MTFLRSKSTESFKKLVKVKTRELALRVLVQKQVQHSKMDAHSYLELKPQNYLSLKNARIEHIRNVFRFRTRTENFGDNFKSSGGPTMCPLCNNHYDTQSLSFQCAFHKYKLKITCDLSDINTEHITLQTAKTITEIVNLRSK